jgi:hypothetical protein
VPPVRRTGSTNPDGEVGLRLREELGRGSFETPLHRFLSARARRSGHWRSSCAGSGQTEAATMRRWLAGWQQPVSADPDAGAHAGHGQLHIHRRRR